MDFEKMKLKCPSLNEDAIKKYFDMLPKSFDIDFCAASIVMGMYLENTMKVFKRTDSAQFMIDFCANEFKEETFVSVMENDIYSLMKVDIKDLDNFISDDEFRNKIYGERTFVDITEDFLGALENDE